MRLDFSLTHINHQPRFLPHHQRLQKAFVMSQYYDGHELKHESHVQQFVVRKEPFQHDYYGHLNLGQAMGHDRQRFHKKS